jgi:hypothetical protein
MLPLKFVLDGIRAIYVRRREAWRRRDIARQRGEKEKRGSETRLGECLDQRQNSAYTDTGSWLVGSPPREKEHHRKEADDRRQAPKGVHGLQAGSGERLNQRDGSDRTAEHAEHRGAPHLISRRQPRELYLDKVKIILQPVEVAADLIGLSQR